MTSKFQNHITTIVGTLATITLTLISDFILDLPNEITWLTFFVGSIVTITATFLEQRLLNETTKEINNKLDIYVLLEQISDPELLGLAKEAVENCVNTLRNYRSGFITSDEHIYTVYNQRLALNTQSLQSLFWAENKESIYKLEDSYEGITYCQKQKDAIDRGAEIERIFVCSKKDYLDDDDNFRDKKTQNILQKQIDDGVNVRITWLEDWGSFHNSEDLYRDFGIFDGNVVAELRYGVRQSRHGTLIVKNEAEIRKYQRIYQRVRELSNSLEPLILGENSN